MYTILLILAIPMAINILAVSFWRGWARALAVLPLTVLVAAFGLDSFSGVRGPGGNLTGLFTMIVAPPAIGLLLLIGIVNGLAMLARTREETKA